jgi:hypothetical protein
MVRGNLLPCLHKLNERDIHHIAFALRRKGKLPHLPNFSHATVGDVALFEREVVIAALREVAATYPPVLNTLSKLL